MKEDVILHILAEKENLYKKENINRYLDMVENKIFIKDTFDKAIAAMFELVIEKQINPWEIDLAAFSNLYMEKVKKEGINLIAAGKILLLAWKILRMQSEEMIKSMERREEEIYFDDAIPDWYADDELFLGTQKIMRNEIVLKPKIRRKAKRKVTLIELINAFEEAKEEIMEKKKRAKKIIKPVRMEDSTHKEDIQKDIKEVMEKLSKLNGEAVPLRKIFGRNILSVFLPLLYLAKDGIIEIWQENFPFGEIYIKLKHEN